MWLDHGRPHLQRDRPDKRDGLHVHRRRHQWRGSKLALDRVVSGHSDDRPRQADLGLRHRRQRLGRRRLDGSIVQWRQGHNRLHRHLLARVQDLHIRRDSHQLHRDRTYQRHAPYTFTVAATNGAGPGLASDPSNSVTPVDPLSGATFVPLTPARILDTRNGTGLSGALHINAAGTFAVTGRGGVPTGATAVTGNLTVTGQTGAGLLYIGPIAADYPGSSTLNFPVGDNRANGITVELPG